ncbi:MAG: ATP-binding cassette domain-containing protein [Clostridiales bacterium]|jgi:iron complex transport system ATP-binding protein|nr:ATP-binding cassette domain-containing protein [Clostridiales bacterium]
MLAVQNIVKKYNNNMILDDISLSIPKGALTGLIGANGAGKSTLLSIMSRLVRQDSGNVYLNDQLISKYKTAEIARQVAVLRQSNNLNLNLTIRELVSFGRYPHTRGRLKSKDYTIIDQALQYLQLQDMQHKSILNLSGGERQRALIAMTVAQDTPCILLDEPLNNLDMKHASAIMSTLHGLVQDTGRTFVVVLHDINCAACYCDYIVALKDCRIVKSGTPEQIMQKTVIDYVFDIDCHIHEICEMRVCIHYNQKVHKDTHNCTC